MINFTFKGKQVAQKLITLNANRTVRDARAYACNWNTQNS